LTVSTNSRRTYLTQLYVSSHWLSNKAVFLCIFDCYFPGIFIMIPAHVRIIVYRTLKLELKTYRSFAYWP